jgi:hypothetical protein
MMRGLEKWNGMKVRSTTEEDLTKTGIKFQICEAGGYNIRWTEATHSASRNDLKGNR